MSQSLIVLVDDELRAHDRGGHAHTPIISPGRLAAATSAGDRQLAAALSGARSNRAHAHVPFPGDVSTTFASRSECITRCPIG
eukprot:3006486-Prymnesium_polylepis.1